MKAMDKKTTWVDMGYCLNCNAPIVVPVTFADFAKGSGNYSTITVNGSCGEDHIKPKFIVEYAEFVNARNGEIL